MRNDLSRVAVPGSVAVPELFTVERYPTVHQMTSTVTATLAPGRDAVDVIGALFPCGSITGAPKKRAVEIVAEVEERTRGVYCGAIRADRCGWARCRVERDVQRRDPDADDSSRRGDDRAGVGHRGGLGSGGRMGRMPREGRVPDRGRSPIVRPDRDDGVRSADGAAAARPAPCAESASAAAFGFAFDRHTTRNELQAATFRLRVPRRIRLLLARSGAIAIQAGTVPAAVPSMTIAVVPLPVAPGDFRLRHKTSERGFYDAARREAGTDEVVFERLDGRLTEGSFTSLFVARDDGMLVTPSVDDGLLPGVLRADLIESGRAVEGSLTRADLLPGRVFVGNALRGLVPATLGCAIG